MKDLILRFAEPKDAVDIAAIYAPYVLDTCITFETEVPAAAEMENRIRTISPKFPYLVCEIDSKVVGYAYGSVFKTRAAYQWDAEVSVYLDARFHRHRIATALYSCLLDFLKVLGYCNAYAVITYPNDKSVALHKVFGFEDVGIMHRTGYKLGKWLDVLTMEKALTEGEGAPLPIKPVQEIDRGYAEKTFKQAQTLIRV